MSKSLGNFVDAQRPGKLGAEISSCGARLPTIRASIDDDKTWRASSSLRRIRNTLFLFAHSDSSRTRRDAVGELLEIDRCMLAGTPSSRPSCFATTSLRIPPGCAQVQVFCADDLGLLLAC